MNERSDSLRRFARSRTSTSLAVALIAFASWLSFARILGWYFIDVDTFTLISTCRIRDLHELRAILTGPLMQDLMPNARFFRPLTSISWGLDERLWGLRPVGFHLTDLVLHTLNAQLLFLFTRSAWLRLGPGANSELLPVSRRERASRFALAVALLFGVNPAQGEFLPVIARRADLLAVLFYLTTLLALLAYLERPNALRLALAAVCCLLGLLSKETSLLLPVSACLLLVAASHQPNARATMRELAARGWPFLLVTLLYLGWHTVALGGLGGYSPEQRGPSHWQEFLVSSGICLLLFVAPGHLNRASVACGPHLTMLVYTALVLLIVVAGWCSKEFLLYRRQRLLFWLLGNAMALVLMPLGVGTLVPRHMYLHSVFFALALVWLCIAWHDRVLSLREMTRQPRAWAWLLIRAAALACIVMMLRVSPLFGSNAILEKWRETAEVTRVTVEHIALQLRTVPPRTTLFLVNFPYRIQAGENPQGISQPESTILLEHSVQGFVDLEFEQQRFDVVGLTYLTYFSADETQREVEVHFEAKRRELFIRANRGAFASLFPWPNTYGRHKLSRIYRSALERLPSGSATGRGIRLELSPNFGPRSAAFLIYTGKGVELRQFEDFTLDV